MAYDEDDEFDDESTGSGNDSALVKDLRKQLRAAKKENADLTERVTKSEGASRERTVKEVIAANGVRPGVSKFVPKDIMSEEDVLAWLKDNAEDLGFSLSSPEQDAEADEDSRGRELSQRAVPPKSLKDLESRMAAATSNAEVDEILREAQKLVL